MIRPVLAGPIRHRVEVQAASRARDSYGDEILSWVTTATRWAAIEPLSGDERLEAAQIHGQVTHRVRVRGHITPRPTPRDRVLFKGRVFEIEHVIDLEERNRALELLVREEV